MTLVLGRLILASLTVIYGSALLLYSESNFDLILNSVAVSFVLDIDNYMYAYFTGSGNVPTNGAMCAALMFMLTSTLLALTHPYRHNKKQLQRNL